MTRSFLVHARPLALAAVALALAACAPAGAANNGGAARAGGAATAEVCVVATDFKFDPPSIKLPAAKPITLVLDNKGSVEHDLHVPALNIELHAMAGQRATTTVTAAKAGSYDVDCTIAGHKELGMKGAMVVSQ